MFWNIFRYYIFRRIPISYLFLKRSQIRYYFPYLHRTEAIFKFTCHPLLGLARRFFNGDLLTTRVTDFIPGPSCLLIIGEKVLLVHGLSRSKTKDDFLVGCLFYQFWNDNSIFLKSAKISTYSLFRYERNT